MNKSKKPQYISIPATVLSPVNDQKCQLIQNAQVTFENKKSCAKILSLKSNFLKGLGASDIEIVEPPAGHEWVLLPGMVDLHFHWVQDAVRLMPKASLLTWLKQYTWPYEAKFAEREFSRQKALEFSQELLRFGTIAGACYSSLHPHTVSDALENFKGHFFVGNPIMTEQSPEYLTHTEAEAMRGMRSLVKKWGRKYVVTPRFAPTVNGKFLSKLGKFRKEQRLFMQTHLSETLEECDYVLNLYRKFTGFEDASNYTELYRRAGLLSAKSIFGHAIHLSDEEWKLLRVSRSAIAHCPTSNAPVADLGLGSGLFDFERANREGVRWALGSDIGGGPFLSMFDVMESFIKQNMAVGNAQATAEMALYRATLAGAQILGLGQRIGSVEVGKDASFILCARKKTLTTPTSVDEFLKEIFKKNRGGEAAQFEQVVITFVGGKKFNTGISN